MLVMSRMTCVEKIKSFKIVKIIKIIKIIFNVQKNTN